MEQALFDSIDSLYFGTFKTIKTDLRAAVASGVQADMEVALKELDDMGAEISGHMDEAFAMNIAAAAEEMSSQAAMLQGMVARFKLKGQQNALPPASESRNSAPSLPAASGPDYIF